ncbi:MAG: hypothetical protein IPN29_19015 [Saprospiraceae bacterium]|nr:hypothetical protein [Saprospiraceae bacterium]
MSTDNPILNSPYEEPKLHYATVASGPEKGALDYTNIKEGRRVFDPDSEGQAIPTRQTSPQGELFDINDFAAENLIIEITGISKDKEEKKWYVENRWLPAVNSLQEKYGYEEWHFIEVANDIRNIKNQLIEKIATL